MKPILVVYGNPLEGKYLKYQHKKCIGCGGHEIDIDLRQYRRVILFGTCGALKPYPLDEFIIDTEPFRKFVCVDSPVHDKKRADGIRERYPHAKAVEMEHDSLRLACDDAGVPLTICKFVSDFCDRKAKPWGINHFWRKYQLWRMQKKFDGFMGVL